MILLPCCWGSLLSKPWVRMQNPNRTGLLLNLSPSEADIDPIRIRTPSAKTDPNLNPECRNRTESKPRVPKPIESELGKKPESERRIRTQTPPNVSHLYCTRDRIDTAMHGMTRLWPGRASIEPQGLYQVNCMCV